ncbi:hypothetical protein PHYSODRAFT_522554, partial [Phytophthora sojae]
LVTLDFDLRALGGLRRRVARVHFNNAETRLATHLLVHDQRSRLQYRHLLSATITQGGFAKSALGDDAEHSTGISSRLDWIPSTRQKRQNAGSRTSTSLLRTTTTPSSHLQRPCAGRR